MTEREPGGDDNVVVPMPVRRTAQTIVLSDVAPRRVEWLWHHRIPLGKLTVIDGAPDVNKSTLTLAIAAAVTRGRPLLHGEDPLPQGGVMLLSSEDGIADTVRPRAELAGADLSKIVVVRSIERDGVVMPPVIPQDLPYLERVMVSKGIRLVVIDPLFAYLSNDVNSYKDQDVRGALLLLQELAERTMAAVIIVRHLTKQGGKEGRGAMNAGGGSVAIIAAARSGMLVVRDQADPNVRRLARVKGNNAPSWPTLSYRVQVRDEHPYIEWIAGSDDSTSADELLEQDDGGTVDDAIDLIRQVLAKGPRKSRDLDAAAEAAGMSPRTMKRARKKLGCRAKQEHDGWLVSLPGKLVIP